MADDDKMVDRGDAVSSLGDSKHGFKTVDGGRAVVEDTEAAILEDVEVAKVEAVYRKIDRRIIPPFWILYFLCSAIRSNVGLSQTMNASVHHDLASILHLTAKQVSLGLALFYVSYVIFDLPSNLIMSRLSPRVWMARIVFAVGVIGACFAAIKAAWSLFLLRFLLGVVTAGMWPGMAYYLTLFYPPSRTGKRIGYYFSAAQLSAAVGGLVSAGFQEMDGLHGLVGFQWMFLVYGVLGAALGIALLWWLPERPLVPGQVAPEKKGLLRWLPSPKPILTGEDAEIHYRDLGRVYHVRPWTTRDLLRVLADWRLWPLVIMYFGVVGVGIGTQLYGSVIIAGIDPGFSSITVSLLFAPIWIMDLLAILLITPLSDRFHRLRPHFFITAVLVQIAGLLTTTFAPPSRPGPATSASSSSAPVSAPPSPSR
ncbi:hypothetical protein VC83_08759 [Pseudogymnoascus destructans]|uniref:Major facilitator superfamily (MFS) profile domain-containing protein n=1 Tax=Pseudogymnoascus destructans TaxID=655981 RepID=A0A177A154_9PEZI|nr:uncharacterized protein VC83_08759 [Pseudogymnoascus destructans]OAF55011.2 hypothetical protein VC83_08759 [Pseudogymnoascus destructans]